MLSVKISQVLPSTCTTLYMLAENFELPYACDEDPWKFQQTHHCQLWIDGLINCTFLQQF